MQKQTYCLLFSKLLTFGSTVDYQIPFICYFDICLSLHIFNHDVTIIQISKMYHNAVSTRRDPK